MTLVTELQRALPVGHLSQGDAGPKGHRVTDRVRFRFLSFLDLRFGVLMQRGTVPARIWHVVIDTRLFPYS